MDVLSFHGRCARAAQVLVLLMCGPFVPAWASAENEEAQIKAISRRYGQIEAQLERSIHYTGKETIAETGEVETRELWCTAAGEAIKVAVERTGPKGRLLREIFVDSDEVQLPIFLLSRHETPLPEGGTQVEEKRQFFGGTIHSKKLVRSLEKSAQFRAGEALDTAPVKNIAQNLTKLPPAELDPTPLWVEEEKIADQLREGKPDRDPGAGITGDSAKFRLIHRTVSPDGRFALALGMGRAPVDWDSLVDKDEPRDEIRLDQGQETKGLKNYVIDLTTRRIIGETGAQYFGTRALYNHDGCEVVWSPDSTIFVQCTYEKWEYGECRAGRLGPGPRLLGTVDFGAAADKQALAFLAAKKDAAWRKHRREHKPGEALLDTLLYDWEIGNDGVVRVTASGEVPKSGLPGDYYTLEERLRVLSGPKGVRVEPVATRYLSQ